MPRSSNSKWRTASRFLGIDCFARKRLMYAGHEPSAWQMSTKTGHGRRQRTD